MKVTNLGASEHTPTCTLSVEHVIISDASNTWCVHISVRDVTIHYKSIDCIMKFLLMVIQKDSLTSIHHLSRFHWHTDSQDGTFVDWLTCCKSRCRCECSWDWGRCNWCRCRWSCHIWCCWGWVLHHKKYGLLWFNIATLKKHSQICSMAESWQSWIFWISFYCKIRSMYIPSHFWAFLLSWQHGQFWLTSCYGQSLTWYLHSNVQW